MSTIVSTTATDNAYANGNEITYGECELTISIKDVGFENSVSATDYCEPVMQGFFGAGSFHLSGVYSGTVEYSGQQFTISNPFSPNIHEILTVYLVDEDGKEIGDYIRISGKSRIDTALQVSQLGWPDGLIHPKEKAVILARADNPADALAGAGLAGGKTAPVLLTYPSKLEERVVDEIRRLNTEKIYLLGGTSAISSTVENELRTLGFEVERVAGADRFETAAKINKKFGIPKGG